MKNRITMAGFAAAVLGLMLVFGQTFGSAGPTTVSAGNGSFTPGADPTVNTATSIPATCVPGQTCPNTATSTPVDFKTHTPTATPTSGPTEPAPTEAPPNTPAPAPTSPGSGNEGAAIAPPNTGSGDGTMSSDSSMWLLVAGAMLIVLGSGAALVGIRQRR